MLSGLLSIMLLGSTSYDDFEFKTEEELESDDVNVYSYYSEIIDIRNLNEIELHFMENEETGTFDSPAVYRDWLIHLFTHQSDVNGHDSDELISTALRFRVNNVYSEENTLEIIEGLEGYEPASDGYEWRIFEIETSNESSTAPNIGVWVKQSDFTIYEDSETPIEHEVVIFEDTESDAQLYENGRMTTTYAKQIPSDGEFYLHYQNQDSDDSFVLLIEDLSNYEGE